MTNPMHRDTQHSTPPASSTPARGRDERKAFKVPQLTRYEVLGIIAGSTNKQNLLDNFSGNDFSPA